MPFQTEKREDTEKWEVASWCCQTEPQLIYDSMHFVIHAPVKKRQQTADTQTNTQTFNWHFCRTDAAVMIELSCGVCWWYKESSWAQRHAHRLQGVCLTLSSCCNACFLTRQKCLGSLWVQIFDCRTPVSTQTHMHKRRHNKVPDLFFSPLTTC